MLNESHAAHVDAWMAEAAHGLNREQQLELFQRAMAALLQRARPTLGDVTLTAILDRVVHVAAGEHAFLALLRIDDTGLRFEGLRAGAAQLSPNEVAAAMRTVVVGFLTLLGSLTADILTPALHLALARARADRTDP